MKFGFNRIDLKLRLTLQVVGLAGGCFVLASITTVIVGKRSEQSQMEAIADVVANGLKLQLEWAEWVKVGSSRFPDLEVVAAPFVSPGLCIAFRPTTGLTSQQFCSGTQPHTAPELYTILYRSILTRSAEAVRPISLEGQLRGYAVVSVDVASSVERSWHEAGRLLALMAATMIILCLLIYGAVARLLKPTRIIVSGLEALSSNRFSTRLPKFDLAELSAIRHVFNSLAETLESTTAERNALTRRLIEVQDEERLALSRELHDEFGQSLAAIAAMAASAQQTAEEQFPELSFECEGISRITEQMMEKLRDALMRLRPPEISELGLLSSLQDLVTAWGNRLKGKPACKIEVIRHFDDVPAVVATNLYRIVQEAITNAARHANARQILVRLDLRESPSTELGASEIEVSVEDDGVGIDPSAKTGMGLIGMRERVSALGGSMRLDVRREEGTRLRVSVPLQAPTPERR